MNTFFDSLELSNIQRPALTLQLSADTAIALDDTIDRDDRTYTVKRLVKYRVDGQVVMQAAVLA